MRLQFLLLLAAILPVHAEWRRLYMGPKGSYTEAAPPHGLAYFSREVFLRPESCEECTPEVRTDVEKNSAAAVVKAGEVGGLEVYDVNYRDQQASAGKSVIVRTGADEYHEIFYASKYLFGMYFSPTKLVRTGDNQTLTWFQVDFPGSSHYAAQIIFRVNSDGAEEVDLAPLWEIGQSLLPAGGALYSWNPELMAGATAFTFRATAYADCPLVDRPCSANVSGTVEVDFRLDGDHVTPLGRRYIP